MGLVGSPTATVDAVPFTYDVPTYARVDAYSFDVVETSPPPIKSSRKGSASPLPEVRGSSTTPHARSVATEEGLSLSGRMQTESAFGDKAIQNALKVPGEEGYFDVVGHGTPSDVSGMSPAELAAKLEANPGWGGQNVRLLSCSTGCPSGTYAQDLANQLGVTVQAPTTDFLVSGRGGITFLDGGGWQWFRPGG